MSTNQNQPSKKNYPNNGQGTYLVSSLFPNLNLYLAKNGQTGNGTFETLDGQSITWISSDMVTLVDDRWVFHGMSLFDNTQSESLPLLNNSIGLIESIAGNDSDYIWLLE